LYGECGPWFNDKNIKERRWMLSDRENIHRMRCKLIENDFFNIHEESSRLRDNLYINKTIEIEEPIKNERRESIHGYFNDEHEYSEISNEIQLYLSEEKEKM